MHLKRLDIQGFKSFSDRTTLDFDSGITSIVGPNGCGKSNIADAIRWVLGEQSMKAIRGSKLEDVVFAGTEYRKQVGFAEVSLTLDNSDGVLPLDFLEVTISRRFFRSGESEFLINKTPCRLKDIYNLFLDTGVGRDGYSIIGQGRIDEILSTKSEDRRNVFEEASGIMKFKVQKQESEKKLEQTRQNLLRINDILNELFTHLEPLKQQAETAKKYLSLRDKLKNIEINVYIDQITKLKQKLKDNDESYNSARAEKNELSRKIESVSKEKQDMAVELKNLEDELDISKRAFYSIETNLEKNQGELNLNNEKISSLTQTILRIDAEILTLSKNSQGLSMEIAKSENNENELNIKHAQLLETLAMAEETRNKILNALNKHERQLEQIKTDLMDKLDLLSDKKIQVANINSHIQNLNKQKLDVEKEIKAIGLDINHEIEQSKILGNNIKEMILEFTSLKDELELLMAQKKSLNTNLSLEQDNKNLTISEIQVKSSKQRMLKSMENNLEGYNRTVKAFLQASNKDTSLIKGVRGALGQLISVNSEYSMAIEVALGGVIQNIVTETEEDAKLAIDFLKRNKMGRATFLPITSVRGSYLNKNVVNRVKECIGFCGIASDLIEHSPEYSGIILNFLGRVVIVKDLDSGIAMARKFKYGFRIVTIDGDMLNTSGAISGGSRDVNVSGILGRTNQIEELELEIKQLNKRLSDIEDKISVIVNKLNKCSDDISKKQNSLREKELLKMKEENNLSNVLLNIKNISARQEMLNLEVSQLSKQEIDSSTEIDKYIKEQSDIEESVNNLKSNIEQYGDKQKENVSARDSISEQVTLHKIAINSVIADINGVRRDLERYLEEKNNISKDLTDKQNQKKLTQNQITLVKEKNIILNNMIKTYQEEKIGKNISIDKLGEERNTLEEDLRAKTEYLENVNNNISLLNEELNRIAIKKAKSETELDSTQNRLWDEYELTYNNALIHKKDIDSLSKAQKEINQYKEQIKELGVVNVSAIDDYIKTKERYEFMNTQKNDLEDAGEKLKKIILEINILMEKQFNENFNLINKNFNIVFKELFGGGMANLRLVDKNNVLECGIEIEVQPPGKKLQNMMLLSGGERAFTAIALLFSILLLNPVSFCVLDEIEASLDDANVSRFASYLRELSQKTQFLVITHRKGTMEVADSIYGVTMQEKGISKVVSMRINEKTG